MNRILLVFLVVYSLLAVFVATASPEGVSSGAVSDGYKFNDGYWWKGNWAYTRAWKPYTYCDSYGCCHRGYRWEYYKHHEYKAPAKSQDDKSWRQGLLELKREKQRFEGHALRSAQDHREYIEAIKVFGLDAEPYASRARNLAPDAGSAYKILGEFNQVITPVAAQGKTVAGYDLFAEDDRLVDLKILYNQVANNVSSVIDLNGRAVDSHIALVQLESDKQNERAALKARAAAAIEFAKALNTPGSKTETNLSFMLQQREDGTIIMTPQPGNGAGGEIDVDAGAGLDGAGGGLEFTEADQQALMGVIQRRCVSCHNPDNAKGGLDMTQFLALDGDAMETIIERLETDDPDLLMPRAANGGPGEPLPFGEILLFNKAHRVLSAN